MFPESKLSSRGKKQTWSGILDPITRQKVLISFQTALRSKLFFENTFLSFGIMQSRKAASARMTVQCQNEIKCLAPLPWQWWWFNKMPKENSSSQSWQKLHHKISFLFVGVIIVLGGCLLLGRFCIIASGCIVVGAYKLTYFKVSL